MESMTVRNCDELTLDDLYKHFGATIVKAESLEWAWPKRGRPACAKCIEVLRQFAQGAATTDDVKLQFKTMTKLSDEVLLNDMETNAVFCLAETAHAAAHLGHLVVSMSKAGKANREYDSLQKAYVMFGLEGVERFADNVHRI